MFENGGAEFTRDYGDIDKKFYDSVESVLDELVVLLREAPGSIRCLVNDLRKWSRSPGALAGDFTIT